MGTRSDHYSKVAGGFDRTADIPGKGGIRFITAANAVAGVVLLEPGDTNVIAEIPLAAANDYAIHLPPVGECVGQTYSILGRRATGSYVDGEVDVDDRGDAGLSATDGLSANSDRLVIRNFMGIHWDVLVDITTS